MGSSMRVLHVDDEPGFSDLLEAVLTKETSGGTVITASSAEEALKILNTTTVDCIVSDYDMPGKNGLEFLTDVRDSYPELPFILFTGKGSETIASEAITVGVTDYLQKGAGKEHYELLVNRITHAVSQYHAEQEIRETREYFSTILAHTSDYIMIVDDTGSIEYVTSAISRIIGYSAQELLGTNAFDLVHPDDIETAAETFRRVLAHSKEEFVVEFRVQHQDESLVWLEVRGRNLLDDPIINGIVVDARDITARKTRETKLETLTESLQGLFLAETTDEIIDRGYRAANVLLRDVSFEFYFMDSPEIVVLVPPPWGDAPTSALQSIDLTQAEPIRNAIDANETLHVDRKEASDEYLQTALSAEYTDIIPIESHGILLMRYAERPPTREDILSLVELLASNISAALEYIEWKERVQAREAEVTKQNKRLEEFTSIVSHDLRNPLNIAQGRLELARNEVTSEHLDAVENAHTRMLNLIDDLLALAKYGETINDPDSVDLTRIAAAAWRDVGRNDITFNVPDTSQELRADPTQLRQLLENLFQNAVEHGQTVSELRVGQHPHGFFVEDDGKGISPDERDAVFTAGYSSSAEGNGFGLRVVQLVADAHNWEIEITDGSDGGTRFEITTDYF